MKRNPKVDEQLKAAGFDEKQIAELYLMLENYYRENAPLTDLTFTKEQEQMFDIIHEDWLASEETQKTLQLITQLPRYNAPPIDISELKATAQKNIEKK